MSSSAIRRRSVHAAAGPRREARDARRALVTLWCAWLVLMTGTNLATPLYAVYAKRFGFSSLLLTVIFAVYAIVLVPSLILFGRLSDRFGRRVVILLGLGASVGGLVLFAYASSTAWLFGARALQGLAVGMISGAATAALVELDVCGDERRPAMLAGLAQAGGSGLGPLVAGALAEWAPDPLRLSFLALLACTLVAAALVFALVPREASGDHEPWRIQLPRVPAEIRGDFARVGLAAGTVWGALALSLSIVPSYVEHILATHDLALIGALGALALGSSCIAQLAARRLAPPGRRVQAGGLTILTVGMLALAAAGPLHSLAVLLAGAVCTGAGHGFAFVFAQYELNMIAPSERRGEVTAAFVSCIYVVVATAVIGAGLLDLVLSLNAAVSAVAVGLGAVATATAAWELRAARST
ncbi:MAG TPA: MFS transporter [Candidatus Binatia bacterium]|nr:MFS transporter [Candidatus Binatia bacterium]